MKMVLFLKPDQRLPQVNLKADLPSSPDFYEDLQLQQQEFLDDVFGRELHRENDEAYIVVYCECTDATL
ncbi:MAG: hypothetical protein WCH30_07170, partial [Chlorobiaceae bacterium]